MPRENITDKEQGDLERAENDSAIPLQHFDGKQEQVGEKKFIRAYDNQPQGNPGSSSNDSVTQPGNAVGSHNDKPAVFETPGRANNRQSLIQTSQAAATATMKVVDAVVANDGGDGYEPGDTVTPNGAFNVKAVLEVETVGLVVGQDETNFDGSGSNGTFNGGIDQYFAGDQITMSDGSVILVDAATAGEINQVTEFTVLSGPTTGVSTNNDTLTQSSTTGGGTGFTITMGTDNQAIATVSIDTAGSYGTPLTNPVTQDTTSGGGSGATFTLDWGVGAIAVTYGGSGYGSAPVVTVSGTATATAIVSSGMVTSVSVTAAGSGYTATATVTIDAP
jgi:hypothetical protein